METSLSLSPPPPLLFLVVCLFLVAHWANQPAVITSHVPLFKSVVHRTSPAVKYHTSILVFIIDVVSRRKIERSGVFLKRWINFARFKFMGKHERI